LSKIKTRVVETAHGGRHFFFTAPDDVLATTSVTNMFGPGVDFKGNIGQVVDAGSQLTPVPAEGEGGGVYTLLQRVPLDQIPMLPEPLAEAVRAHRTRSEAQKASALALRGSVQPKATRPEVCCRTLAVDAVEAILGGLDELCDLAKEDKTDLSDALGIPGAAVGWDTGPLHSASRLTEIAEWPWSDYTPEQAQADFLEHAPEIDGGTYKGAELKWADGHERAQTWGIGERHRYKAHGGPKPDWLDEKYPASVLRDPATGNPIRSEAAVQRGLRLLSSGRQSEERNQHQRNVSAEVERKRVSQEANRQFAEEAADLSSWDPIDLTAALDAGPVMPDVGKRSDEAGVFYSGKLNVVFGESEGGKTWLALHVAQQVMEDDESPGEVVFLDYEDDERSVTQRLLTIGVERQTILRSFHYLAPEGPFTDAAFEQCRARFARARLVVIDATTEALAAGGLDSNSDTDIAAFYNRYPKRIAALGPAVVVIDHVTKSVEGRGQQIGSQMKKAGVDGVSYGVEPIEPFTKGQRGASMVVIGKDKQGGIREHGVFGGEGKPARFGLFTMTEFGTTRLAETKAAESKESTAVKKHAELTEAIRQYPGEIPGVRVMCAWLRDDRGMTFSNADAQAIVRSVKSERAASAGDSTDV